MSPVCPPCAPFWGSMARAGVFMYAGDRLCIPWVRGGGRMRKYAAAGLVLTVLLFGGAYLAAGGPAAEPEPAAPETAAVHHDRDVTLTIQDGGYDGADDAGTLSHRRGAGRDARLLRNGGAAGTGGGGAQLCVLSAGGGAQGRPPERGLLHRPHLLQRLPVRDGGQGEVGRRLRPVEYTGGAGGQRHGRTGGAVQRPTHSGGVPLLLRRADGCRRGRVERRPAPILSAWTVRRGRRRCPTTTAP